MTEDVMLDGNVLAGRLRDVFAFEATTSMATCGECGNRGPVAGWSVFLSGPGIVARCAVCHRAQFRLVEDDQGRMWIELSGVRSLEVAT